jgi:thiamine biosynthesis lipoprotein
MRHVIETMGTVASIEVPRSFASAIPIVVATFEQIESRFSLYRPDSELSRIARGEIALADASEPVIATYARALAWRGRTGGVFTPHRPDGVVDLNGIVKAEAIEAAGVILNGVGCTDWSINVGGDILVRSLRAETTPIGIVDPQDRLSLLCSVVLRGSRRALATSGSAERGDHVWLGSSLKPAEFVQVTVVADDIITADVLATTIVAGGRTSLDQATDEWDIDVLAVDRAGALVANPGFRSALAAA